MGNLKKILLVSVFAAGYVNAAEVPAVFDVKNCKLEYPKMSLMNEEQGTVGAAVLVAADGAVQDVKIEKPSNSKNLDKATQKGLMGCKFKPGTKDGAPAQTWAKVEYKWSLE